MFYFSKKSKPQSLPINNIKFQIKHMVRAKMGDYFSTFVLLPRVTINEELIGNGIKKINS